MTFHAPQKDMVNHPTLGLGFGNNGFFMIRMKGKMDKIRCIASNGEGWEHVSVSWPNRLPTWTEMCEIKDIFWDAEDCVVQYHPPKSLYVNNHEFCLHLWRPLNCNIPMPDSLLVSYK